MTDLLRLMAVQKVERYSVAQFGLALMMLTDMLKLKVALAIQECGKGPPNLLRRSGQPANLADLVH